MPSPIAHCSLMFLVWPAVKRRFESLSAKRRSCLAVLLLFALVAPDADILIGPLTGQSLADLRPYHNGPSNSVFFALVFALPFAALCRAIAGKNWAFFAIIGVMAYGSHIFLDALTSGRGIQFLWPITEERFKSPILPFRGVKHSIGAPPVEHLLTVVQELVFAALMWLAARRMYRKRRSDLIKPS